MRKLFLLFAGMLISGMAMAQPLRLRGLNSYATPRKPPATPMRTLTPGRFHLLVQFPQNPSSAQLEELAKRGATVLSYVPDFAFSLSVPEGFSWDGLDIHWTARLRPDEKISAAFEVRPGRAAIS